MGLTKDDREKGARLTEWGVTHTRMTERMEYGWLNGCHAHRDDREKGVRLLEWGVTHTRMTESGMAG